MTKKIFFLNLVSISLVLWAVSDSQTESIAVFLIGDSTMSDKEVRAYPETGWGTPFAHYFGPEVVVENHAVNGRSTRTFLEEGRWNPIIDKLKEGDYVFIQFGHNDEVPTKPQATTEEEFQAYLVKYIRDTRSKQGRPVLLTPVARRQFDDGGNLVDTHKIYSELVRDVARSEEVPLIDMDLKSRELLQDLGPETSVFLYNHLEPDQNPNYPEGLQDDTHFNELGARRMAELVLESIRELDLDLAGRIVQR